MNFFKRFNHKKNKNENNTKNNKKSEAQPVLFVTPISNPSWFKTHLGAQETYVFLVAIETTLFQLLALIKNNYAHPQLQSDINTAIHLRAQAYEAFSGRPLKKPNEFSVWWQRQYGATHSSVHSTTSFKKTILAC